MKTDTVLIPVAKPRNNGVEVIYSSYPAALDFGKTTSGVYSNVECRFYYIRISNLNGIRELKDIMTKAKLWDGTATEDKTEEKKILPRQ